ncbi:tRNA pseudouridine(55) synthase TruB [candidate division WOR-3 bacterium]|nr:tRNA pseudouridine(55) synthase TruB [candidate division WOR-3 bacterium]
MDGFLIVNKPISWSSFDIVKLTRKTIGIKKIGHTGTLDKEASGLLILCIGKATKLVENFMLMEKEYEVEGKLGEKTETDDASGRVIERKKFDDISLDSLRKVVLKYVGEIYQIPPMYSAIKVKGERLYKIARKGKTLKREARKVFIKRIEILSYSPPFFKLNVVCGKGFYIRALIRDIGEKLGTGAHTLNLVRIRIGKYTLQDAINVDDLRDGTKIFSRCIPVI